MHADFNSVEAELREIEADFSSGRMNAFGSAQAQDAFLRELKRIAEIETQVFYKTCSILKSGNTADHATLTNVFASAQPPPQARATSPGSRSTSPSRAHGGHNANRGSSLGDAFDGGLGTGAEGGAGNRFARGGGGGGGGYSTPSLFPSSSADVFGGMGNSNNGTAGGAAPHIKAAEWSNETGFPDRAFEDVAERFHAMEADFNVLGDQLREISKHVMQLNIMSEEVSRVNGSNDSVLSARAGAVDRPSEDPVEVGDADADPRRAMGAAVSGNGESNGRPGNGYGGGGGNPLRSSTDDGMAEDTVSGLDRTMYWRFALQMQVSNELLYNIFAGTLSADKTIREGAEQALGELSNQHPDLVLHLLRFSCEAIPNADGNTGGYLAAQQGATDPTVAQQRNVLLAAAIRVRNVLGRSDWNRNPYFTEAVKLEVRQVVVPLQCQPHVAERVRRQLLDTTKELMSYDYPDNWPGLIPQLNNLLDGWVAALRSALNATNFNTSSDPVASVVLQLKGGLGVLRACCKVFEDPLRVDAAAVDRFASLFTPSLVSLYELFYGLWEQELSRVAQQVSQQLQQVGAVEVPRGGNMFEFSAILTELTHCLRLILKCNWSLMSARMPKCLCEAQAFQQFWQTCYAAPMAALHASYLPMCRARLQSEARMPSYGDATGDHYAVFQESALWKYTKWLYQTAYKLVQEFMRPKQCEKRVRAVASIFSEAYLRPVAESALALVRWHACPTLASPDGSIGTAAQGSPVLLLTSKAYIMSLEILTSAVESKDLYTDLLHPAAEELMTNLLFPRLAFSHEEAELWDCNPEEYVRKQSSPVGDLFSAKVVSASCLLSLATPAATFQDPSLLTTFVNFLMNQFQIFTPQAAQAVNEAQSGLTAMEAARRVDAALYCMVQFKKVIAQMQLGDDKIEFVLTSFVVPATAYPLGFLRARAVFVLSVYAPSLAWSSPQAYQAALQAVLPLLSDRETPVRVQTCVSFSRLIRHPYARDVVTPCIAQLIQHYFDVMRLMDNEAVIHTLRKTITYYHDTLAQWGLELTDMLVGHFQTILQGLAVKYTELESSTPQTSLDKSGALESLEEGALVDMLSAADELLETLVTLVRALPPCQDDSNQNIFVQLQYRISPILYVIVGNQNGSDYGFLDSTLMLLATLIARSPRVVEPTWRLLPFLYHTVMHSSAVDYFAEMLAPLDNYVSVDTVSFVFMQLDHLCGPEAATTANIPAEVLAKTPFQLVQEMAARVLESTVLREREVGAVPKLFESITQNLWVMRRTVLEAPEDASQPRPPAGALEAVVTSAAQQLLGYLGSSPTVQDTLTASGKRKKRVTTTKGTLRILFANAIFSCMLAEPAAAMQTLANFGAISSFYEQYVHTVMGAGSSGKEKARKGGSNGDGVLSCLRSYDRNVFLLAFCEAIQLLGSTPWSALHGTLATTLLSVVQSALLETLAKEEKTASEGTAAFLEKRFLKLQRKHQQQQQQQQHSVGHGNAAQEAGEDSEDDDDDAWEDDSSLDEGCGMGCGDGGFGEDDEDEEWDDDDDDALDSDAVEGDSFSGGANPALGFGSEDAAYFTQDKRLQAMLREAQTLRKGGRKGAAGGDGDDADEDYEDMADANAAGAEEFHDDDDNLLDDEGDDFVSPVDALNPWAVLLDGVVYPYTEQQQALPPPVAALVDALVQQHNPGNILQQTREVVDRLMSVRAAIAEHSAPAPTH